MKNKLIFFAFLLVTFLSVFSCSVFEDSEYSTSAWTIPKEYWGTWIRMDTGDEYYIDSEKIYGEYSYSRNKVVATSIDGYSFDGKNILKNGSTVYFRKGGSARDFSMKVSGFSDSRTARSISTGKQGISGRRENKENKDDNQSATSDSFGTLTFTGAVADDTQKITVEGTSVEITPQYNGENLGTIPITENGTYGFKTTYSIDSDEQGFCFGNYYKTYTLKLNLNNIGSATCKTSEYEVSCTNSNLIFVSGEKSGNFSSIEAGKSKQISFTVKYGKLDTEYVDVPINISITDSQYQRTWEDSVTIRFYKGLVNLKVNARNFDESSSAKLKGFLIYPDGRSKRFTVSHNYSTVVSVPWSESDYQLAFSGASSSNEMAYSFGFAAKTSLAALSGTWSARNSTSEKYILAYEPNDSFTTAKKITDLTKPVAAYLQDGDIDFYTINCKDIEVKFEPVQIIASAVKEYENGNNDGLVTPGESHYLDIKMQNTTESSVSSVTAKLTTSSSYVTISRDSYTIGDMEAGHYYSLTDSSYSESYCDLMDSNYDTKAFKFLVASNCPNGTQLPFTVTFTDSSGNSWTDKFSVTVNTPPDTSSYITLSGSYSTNLKALYLNWNNNEYDGSRVYIWVDDSYSGKYAYTSDASNYSCTGYPVGNHFVVLKNGTTTTASVLSNTISITVTE